MGEEWIGVGRFDDMRRILERNAHIAVAPKIGGRRLLRELGGVTGKARAALRRDRPLVPCDFELLARFVRSPPALRHNGDTIAETLRITAGIGFARLHDEGIVHARQRLKGIDIGAHHLAAEDRAFL